MVDKEALPTCGLGMDSTLYSYWSCRNNNTTWNVASPHSLGGGMWAGTAVVALDTMLWAKGHWWTHFHITTCVLQVCGFALYWPSVTWVPPDCGYCVCELSCYLHKCLTPTRLSMQKMDWNTKPQCLWFVLCSHSRVNLTQQLFPDILRAPYLCVVVAVFFIMVSVYLAIKSIQFSVDRIALKYSPSFYYHINLLSQHFLVLHVGHTPHQQCSTQPVHIPSSMDPVTVRVHLPFLLLFHVYCPFLADPGRRKATTGILHYSVFSSLIALLGPSLFPSTSL